MTDASSNPGDAVLAPFCRCGTTIDAAEKPGRQWIGSDPAIAGQLAISLIKNRLQDTYGSRIKFVIASTPDPGAAVCDRRSLEAKESAVTDRGYNEPVSLVRIIGEPTTPNEAASVGFYEHRMNEQKFPRLQLRTVKKLMEGKGIERPTSAASVDDTFKKAPESKKKHGHQTELKM